MALCAFFTVLIRVFALTGVLCVYSDEAKCQTWNVTVPCVMEEVSWPTIYVYWMISYGICYAQQPGKKLHTKIADKIRSTVFSGKSSATASVAPEQDDDGSTKGSSKSETA